MAAAFFWSEGRVIKQKRTRKRDGARGEAKRRNAHRRLEKRKEREERIHTCIYIYAERMTRQTVRYDNIGTDEVIYESTRDAKITEEKRRPHRRREGKRS